MINNLVIRITHARKQEDGFTTAELLGNAALGVAALAVLWGLLGGVGGSMIDYIQTQMFGGGSGPAPAPGP